MAIREDVLVRGQLDAAGSSGLATQRGMLGAGDSARLADWRGRLGVIGLARATSVRLAARRGRLGMGGLARTALHGRLDTGDVARAADGSA